MNSEEQIKDNLRGIPNCFELRECLVGRAKESIKYIIDGLLREIENKIYELDNEWIRTYNFISFLYWTIGKKDEAIANNKKVLEIDENNVIAIANKIWFYLELEDAYELNITYAKLEKLQRRDDFQIYRIKADAELAYCYTRLGLSLQETARTKCRKVIDNIFELKLEQVIDRNLIVLWKYGLGLITRRVSKLHCSRSADQVSRCRVRRKEAIEAFLDVVHEEWDSKRLKAMAYVQLGEISFAVLKDEQQLKDYFPEPYHKWQEERFYRTALTMHDKETYILERYGQFLRYKKRYEESEIHLRKSLEIRPTSHAHHHLALTLKSKFHRQLATQQKHINRSISSPNKTNNPRLNFRRVQSEQMGGNPHVRNLFGSNSGNHMAAGSQFSINTSFNMPYYDNQSGWQSDQRSYYYDNPHGGQGGYYYDNPYGGQGGYYNDNPHGGQGGYHYNNPHGGQGGYYYDNPYGGQRAYYHDNPHGGQGGYHYYNPHGGQGGYYYDNPYGGQGGYYHDNPHGGQGGYHYNNTHGGQGGFYYDNPHSGWYGPEYNHYDNSRDMYDSGYYSIPPNEQFSTDKQPQYNSQGYSCCKTNESNNCQSNSRSNGRGAYRGNKPGDDVSQSSIPSSSKQRSSTSENMHQRSTTNPQSTSGKSQNHSLLSEQNSQLDSGIESLSTVMQQVTIQDSVESDGAVKLRSPVQGSSDETHTVVANTSTCSRTDIKHIQRDITERTSSTLNVNATKAMIKSPRKLLDLPEADKRTDDIMYHLEQAMVYAENRAALYDKGLTLRAMNHLDEAVFVFKQLIGDETSLIYLANAYEQCGLCHYEKLQKPDIVGDELDRLTYNMKDYFMKSVAISAKLVAAIPNIYEVWASASSLKEVLESDGKSKESLRQLAMLSERLKNYKEAITYYADLISMEDDAKEIPKHFVSKAKNQMNDSNYIAAVTILDVARTHPQGHTYIDRNMYINCLVEGGFQAIETGHDKQLGCKYLNSALCIASDHTASKGSVFIDEYCEIDEEDSKFGLFLLCCEENEHLFNIVASVWGQMKEVCGLNVTLNSLDVLWGTPKVSGRLDLVDKCRHFVIVVSSQATKDTLYQLTMEHIILNKANIIILLEHTDTPLPNVVERFKDRIPHMVIHDTVFDETNISDCVSWLKELMLCLLRVN